MIKIDWAKIVGAIVVSAVLSAGGYMATNLAWASDITRLEESFDQIQVRLIKKDLRDLRHELADGEHDTVAERALLEDIEDAIDDLCKIDAQNRECK